MYSRACVLIWQQDNVYGIKITGVTRCTVLEDLDPMICVGTNSEETMGALNFIERRFNGITSSLLIEMCDCAVH